MFDFATLDSGTRSAAGVPMTILHPATGAPVLDSDGQPVTITLLGSNSDVFRDTNAMIRERRLARQARKIATTAEDIRQDEIDLLTALTKGWSFDTLDGQPLPYSSDNARRLWKDSRWEWVFDLAIVFAQTAGNFMPT